MKKTLFIKNAAVLTVSSLILRFAGVIFKVRLAAVIGAEGIGLYQLVFSVYVLASTFATSGICTAVTRLVSEELALGSKNGVKKIMGRCLALTLAVAAVSIAALLLSADFIAATLLHDSRAALSLKILCASLPAMGISSCLRGYFIARSRATPPAVSQLFEQAVRIALITVLVVKLRGMGIATACAAVIVGDTVAEISSAALLAIVYAHDKGKLDRLSGRENPPFSVVKAVQHIALPITAGRYLNTALRTAENILVPRCLERAKTGGKNALAQFGMIKGMALPILFFPSTLLNSLSTLLIPEMSRAAACGRNAIVRDCTERILRITSLLSYPVAAIFLVAGREIGWLIYRDTDIGFLLCALSPIVPFMYLDSVADGLLKGLDQQLFTFRTSVVDSSLRIAAVLLVLPRLGMSGFIGIMYGSNLLTAMLNVGRLIKVSHADLSLFDTVFVPLCAALFCCFGTRLLLTSFGLSGVVYALSLILFSSASYIALIFAFGCITRDDVCLN